MQHRSESGKLSSGRLTMKYAILHRIATVNWMHTQHTSTISTGLGNFIFVVSTEMVFNYGRYIFDQVMK